MKNILVIADKDDASTTSIQKGLSLADKSGARLEIVAFCFENLDELSGQTGKSVTALKKDILAHKNRVLEERIKKVRGGNRDFTRLSISTDVIWEKTIHEWIAKRTADKLYDLVVKTGHRSEGVFYTPTDWHLIRTSHAPVYLLSDKTWSKKGRVLVALDVDNNSRSKKQLNQLILQAGRTLADTMQVELYCCFIINIPTILKELDIVDHSAYVKKAREKYLPMVVEMVKPFGIPESNIYRDVGDPSGRILKIANKLKVDCMVIGSIGRKGLKGKLIGNTAEQVIRHMYSDMLVINLT